MPEVTAAASAAGVAARIAAAAGAVVLEPGATQALSRLAVPLSGDIVLVVGPEGGISPAEMTAFTAGGRGPGPARGFRAADLDRRGGRRRRADDRHRPLVTRRPQAT